MLKLRANSTKEQVLVGTWQKCYQKSWAQFGCWDTGLGQRDQHNIAFSHLLLSGLRSASVYSGSSLPYARANWA